MLGQFHTRTAGLDKLNGTVWRVSINSAEAVTRTLAMGAPMTVLTAVTILFGRADYPPNNYSLPTSE